LSPRSERLERSQRAFGAKSRLQEIELTRLRRELAAIETNLAELERLMSCALISGLPVFSSIARRVEGLRRRATDVKRLCQLGFRNAVGFRAREQMCGVLSNALREAETRAVAEGELLELLTHCASARLPQVKAD
jgi:hypothetical protein